MAWIRTCQECGYKQVRKSPKDQKTDNELSKEQIKDVVAWWLYDHLTPAHIERALGSFRDDAEIADVLRRANRLYKPPLTSDPNG